MSRCYMYKIVEYTSKIFDFSVEEIKNMYKPIFKSSGYIIFPVNSKTVLFVGDTTYEKDNIKSKLKTGDMARFIFSIKKVTFKDYELCVTIELIQIESV